MSLVNIVIDITPYKQVHTRIQILVDGIRVQYKQYNVRTEQMYNNF